MGVYTINASFREIAQEGFEEHLRRILEQKIGREILHKLDLDIKNFEGKDTVCLEVYLTSFNNKIMDCKELKMCYEFKSVKQVEQFYISRKDEVSIDSRFYTGEKLSWKERLQALFKGRLYGGSLKIQEKVEEERWQDE